MKGFGLGLGIMAGVLVYSAALYMTGFITGIVIVADADGNRER
jgi:hypothetical protein